jgi:hypothetical protein
MVFFQDLELVSLLKPELIFAYGPTQSAACHSCHNPSAKL